MVYMKTAMDVDLALLVQFAGEGTPQLKESAAFMLAVRAKNPSNSVAIEKAGGIPPLVALLRARSKKAKGEAAWALRNLADNNDANAVAIAAAFSSDALVELARRGRVTFAGEPRWISPLLSNASIPAKRKAALVVAALLRDYVPEFKSAPGDIKAAIASYLYLGAET